MLIPLVFIVLGDEVREFSNHANAAEHDVRADAGVQREITLILRECAARAALVRVVFLTQTSTSQNVRLHDDQARNRTQHNVAGHCQQLAFANVVLVLDATLVQLGAARISKRTTQHTELDVQAERERAFLVDRQCGRIITQLIQVARRDVDTSVRRNRNTLRLRGGRCQQRNGCKRKHVTFHIFPLLTFSCRAVLHGRPGAMFQPVVISHFTAFYESLACSDPHFL
jgi:hypothetical protein